jgi:phosphatidate cytidylyltransferase
MLGQRILTAVGLVGVLALVIVVLPQKLAIVALAVLILMGAWEWSQFAGLGNPVGRAAYVAVAAALMAGLWQMTASPVDFQRVMGLTMLGWIPLFGWIVFAPGFRAKGLAAIAGLWALVPTWLALSRLYLQDGNGRELVIFVLLLAWAADIGAYCGRHFGRLRLAPVVSEQDLGRRTGGLIAGIRRAPRLAWFHLPPLAFLSLCVAAILASVVGDLLESTFKRQITQTAAACSRATAACWTGSTA